MSSERGKSSHQRRCRPIIRTRHRVRDGAVPPHGRHVGPTLRTRKTEPILEPFGLMKRVHSDGTSRDSARGTVLMAELQPLLTDKVAEQVWAVLVF